VIQHFSSPETLSLNDLESVCHQETQRYKNGMVSDTRFCLEIFRRALIQINPLHTATVPKEAAMIDLDPARSGRIRDNAPIYADEAARVALVRIYTEFIKAQISRAAIRTTSIDDLVQQVWLRFWQAANNGLTFPSLEMALSYLKQTTVSALIEDQRRERKRRRDESLQQIITTAGEATLVDSGADLFARHTQQRFRVRCREVLTDPLEYRVFWMRYSMALPPRKVARLLATEGVLIKNRSPTARMISDLLDGSFKRLQLDGEIQDLLRGD
jgi:DNA-directed RNA polymerase specialized sigma24 family protein